ncbi:Hypothetical predicted protein, partial [Marmota monax]
TSTLLSISRIGPPSTTTHLPFEEYLHGCRLVPPPPWTKWGDLVSALPEPTLTDAECIVTGSQFLQLRKDRFLFTLLPHTKKSLPSTSFDFYDEDHETGRTFRLLVLENGTPTTELTVLKAV